MGNGGRVVNRQFLRGGIFAREDALVEGNRVVGATYGGISVWSGLIARNVVRNSDTGIGGGNAAQPRDHRRQRRQREQGRDRSGLSLARQHSRR